MQLFRSPWLIACALVFLVHQLMQKVLNIHWPLADRYLDNLLAMPLILSLLLAERRWLFKRGPDYRLSRMTIVLATLYVAVVAEWLFPALSEKFTSDWVDVLMYALGSLLFLFTPLKGCV